MENIKISLILLPMGTHYEVEGSSPSFNIHLHSEIFSLLEAHAVQLPLVFSQLSHLISQT